jgi:hypothetical protein
MNLYAPDFQSPKIMDIIKLVTGNVSDHRSVNCNIRETDYRSVLKKMN